MGDKKKKAQMFVWLVSTTTEKLEFRKFDLGVKRHVLFKEAKMKRQKHTLKLQ